jgi:hypothetical protein
MQYQQDLQALVLRYIQAILKADSRLEVTRQVLLAEPSYHPLACFLRLDRARNRCVTAEDLLHFLQDNANRPLDHDLPISDVVLGDCELLVHYTALDNAPDQAITVNDFVHLVMPRKLQGD